MSTCGSPSAQAVVRFLASAVQPSATASQHRLFAGCFGIFGHGNVAGLGQALLRGRSWPTPGALPYYQGRNEQAMVHTAVGYARQRNRLSTLAVHRLDRPGLDQHAHRRRAGHRSTGCRCCCCPATSSPPGSPRPVLQELEHPHGYDVSVNDAFRPVSRFFDRVWRPEQLPAALLGAMRVLTDPAETGAVTIALPQDVQAEAYDWPDELFAERVWHVARPVPEPAALAARGRGRSAAARRPLIVAGGGVIYAEANDALRAFAEATGIPVAETQAGKGSLPLRPPAAVGAIGATGTTAANALAAEADVVHRDRHPLQRLHHRVADRVRRPRTCGSSTSTSPRSTPSSTPASRVVADARAALEALTDALAG